MSDLIDKKIFSTSLAIEDLASYISSQLNSLFPDNSEIDRNILKPYVSKALERLRWCFIHLPIKGFYGNGEYKYSHLNTDQHAIFLYFLCNTIFNENGPQYLAEKIYALNKLFHSVDIFYEVKMPDIFVLVHPVGTVLGRANYSDYFCAYHNVSIGSDLEGNMPSFGKGVVMFNGSKVIGKSSIGGNCFISLGAIIISEDIKRDSLVFGQSPNLTLKHTEKSVLKGIFNN